MDQIDYRVELIRRIIQYGFDRDPHWEHIHLQCQRGWIPAGMAQILYRKLEKLVQNKIDFPNFLHRPPTTEQFHGQNQPDIRIGVLAERPEIEWGLRFDGPLFVLVTGLTGYGKTTAIRVILKNIHEYNQSHPDKKVVVVVFDRKGGDYADLPGLFGWKHYHAYDTLRLSLENPAGIPPNVWINILASLFCARTGLKAAWVTLANCLRLSLACLNPQPQPRLLWPDFSLCLEILNDLPENMLSSKSEYTRALKQPLEGLTRSMQTFNAFQGFQVQEHLNQGQSMVIAMPNVFPSWTRQLLVDLILSQVLYSRIARSERTDRTNVIFVIDESDHDISASSEALFPDSLCPISQCFKQGREFGIGVIASCSSLCGASLFVRSNATTHINFRCNDTIARLEAARTLMLPQGGDLSLMSLDKGQCLVKQVGNWPHAVIGQVDYMPPSRLHVTHYDTHPYMPSQPLAQLPHVQAEHKKLKAQHRSRHADQQHEDQKDQLDQYSLTLLTLIAKHPFIPAVQLFKSMGNIRFETRQAICQKLVDHQLIDYEEVRLGRRDLALVELTDKGYQFLKLKPACGPQGRGSLAHRTMAHWIMWYFQKQGRKAALEQVIPPTTHSADVGVFDGHRYECFEVCVTTTHNLTDHITACFEQSDRVQKLTIVATTKAKIQDIQRDVAWFLQTKPYRDRVLYDVVETFMPKENLS